MNIGKTELDKIEFDEHKDGTYDQTYESKKKESPKPKQKTLDGFFAVKSQNKEVVSSEPEILEESK